MENVGDLPSNDDPSASAVSGLSGIRHDLETSEEKATAAGGVARGRMIGAPDCNVDDTQDFHVGDVAETLLAIASILEVERRPCELTAHPRVTMESGSTWSLVFPLAVLAALVESGASAGSKGSSTSEMRMTKGASGLISSTSSSSKVACRVVARKSLWLLPSSSLSSSLLSEVPLTCVSRSAG